MLAIFSIVRTQYHTYAMSSMKRKREAMPPEYVKGPGKPGRLHPHWRRSFPDDEEEDSDRGKVVQVPGLLRLYGEWRRVPGFWMILASDEGFIMTEGEYRVREAKPNYKGYLCVGCNGTPEYVHLLTGRAFHGRPNSDQVSVDHKDRNEQNNCVANLRWATHAEQNANRGDRKAHSNGEPCLVWEVRGGLLANKANAYDTTPVVGVAQRFSSACAAATALELCQSHLCQILNGRAKTVANADGKRFTGEWNPDLMDLEDEEWKEKWASEKKALRISNCGRIQWVYSGREGNKHFPESSNPKGYLRVKFGKKQELVHVLVGDLFWIGPKPLNWACWDHKDLDKQNNHIGNLRPVTVEENNLNTARQRDFYLWPVGEPDHWICCVSQNATARAYGLDRGSLNHVLHEQPNKYGSVPKTVGGYCAVWCDKVDKVEDNVVP